MHTDTIQRQLCNPMKIVLGTWRRTFVGPVCIGNIIPHYLAGYVTNHKISLSTVLNDWHLLVWLKMKTLHLMRVVRKHSKWRVQIWMIFTPFILEIRIPFPHMHALIDENHSFHARLFYLFLLKEFREHHRVPYPRNTDLLPSFNLTKR